MNKTYTRERLIELTKTGALMVDRAPHLDSYTVYGRGLLVKVGYLINGIEYITSYSAAGYGLYFKKVESYYTLKNRALEKHYKYFKLVNADMEQLAQELDHRHIKILI